LGIRSCCWSLAEVAKSAKARRAFRSHESTASLGAREREWDLSACRRENGATLSGKGQAHDFTVAGPITEAAQCLEGIKAENGTFYSGNVVVRSKGSLVQQLLADR